MEQPFFLEGHEQAFWDLATKQLLSAVRELAPDFLRTFAHPHGGDPLSAGKMYACTEKTRRDLNHTPRRAFENMHLAADVGQNDGCHKTILFLRHLEQIQVQTFSQK